MNSQLQPISRDAYIIPPREELSTSRTGQVIHFRPAQPFFPTTYHFDALNNAIESTTRWFFDRYAAEWQVATAGLSSIVKKKRHPAYGAILHLGPSVIKYMLEDFQNNSPSPLWFPALKELAGDDPVPPAHRGNVPAMKDAWIAWGRAKRYL
jgi:hypothetical protein